MTRPFVKKLLPFVALCLGLAVIGCDGHISINGDDGVPLSELDMSGEAPTGLALASSDKVVVTEGAKLDIKVSGDPDAVKALRFNIDHGTLGIMRERGGKTEGKALISVTMPPVHEIVLAGSGDIEAPQLVDKAEVNIAGSGTVAIAKVAAEKMSVNLMGSGTLQTAGTAERLHFNLAGSGYLKARALKVERADINIAGSGGGEFASDGKVEANVAGSGNVTVYGRADCKISAMGSGKLNCRPADSASAPNAPAAVAPPTPPAAPEPGK